MSMSVNNILSETAVSRNAKLARDEVLFRSKMKMEWDKVKHHSLVVSQFGSNGG
jgi:hypothetical protein